MATPDELRTSLAEARAKFRTSLESITADWETAPQSGEGEDAWSPRKVAEHAIGAEAFFTNALCEACGYPGVEFERGATYATPADAIVAFDAIVEATNKKLKYVSGTDLPKEHKSLGSSEKILGIAAYHMNDHAAQIAAAGA